MCCLFGLLDYNGTLNQKQKNKIISILATACEARGTDATGIAYNYNNRLCIYKRPLAAHKMKFKIPNGVNLIMGHTRMTTQGNERFNFNNHPFYGEANKLPFALAHNGVLYNDDALKISENLPETKIETDSYVAVQLIEKKKQLSFESLKYMAEQLMGSFTITVMDKNDNLYFVKGDNPMCIYHFPKTGIYIYASTEEILLKALKRIPYKFGRPIKVDLEEGRILMLDRYGKQTTANFDTYMLDSFSYYQTTRYFYRPTVSKTVSKANKEYIGQLKTHANFYGYTDDMVDTLLEEGYSTDDIEEMLYCGAV